MKTLFVRDNLKYLQNDLMFPVSVQLPHKKLRVSDFWQSTQLSPLQI